jgi:translocation and assembly module TamB
VNPKEEVEEKRPKRYFLKFIKIIGWIVSSILLFLLALILLIRIPSIQNKITQKAISFLQEKIGTPVHLQSITISFPKQLVLEGLYIEDQQNDTLLYAGRLVIDTDLWRLTQHSISLNTIALNNVKSIIRQSAADSTFNFDYIIKAFASKSTVPFDTTTRSWDFVIGDVIINQAQLLYKDLKEGNDLNLTIGNLEISIDKFDLNSSRFHVHGISFSNSKITLTQTSGSQVESGESQPKPAVTSIPYDIHIKEINLKNISAHYSHVSTGQLIHTEIGEAHIRADTIDLNKQIIHLDQFELTNSLFAYQQAKLLNENSKKVIPSSDSSLVLNTPWSFQLRDLRLTNNSLQYYDFTQPPQKEGVDFNHLWVFGLESRAENILIEGTTAKINLHHFSFEERSGFILNSLSVNAEVSNQKFKLQDVSLRSGTSIIAMSGEATFESLASLQRDFSQTNIKAKIDESVISMKDLLFFSSTLTDSLPLHIPASTKVNVTAAVSGRVDDLIISTLELQTLDSTLLHLKGTIKDLPDLEKTKMDITLNKFYTTRHDVQAILTDTIKSASFEVPSWVNVNGKFKGGIYTPYATVIITSSSGTIETTGQFSLNNTASYNAIVKVKEFNVGQVLKQKETIGLLDLEASVKGSGLTLNEMDTHVDLTVNKFQYNKYEYKGFKLNGSLKKYLFSGSASMTDKNLDFILKGDLDYQKNIPNYKLTFELKNIDLKALNITSRPLKAKGTLDVDLATTDFKVINGHADVRKFGIYNGADLYLVDSLLFASIDQEGESEISIRSDIVTGDFKGTINLYSMPDVLRQHVNQYFSLQDTSIHKSTAPQNFKFDLVLKNTDLLTEIIFPDLEPFVPGKISGEFNSLENKLDLFLGVSKIKYASTSVDSLVLKLTSDKESMDYRFAVKNLKADTLHIDELNLTGQLENDSIYASFNILDSLGKQKYTLGGVIQSEEDNFRFHFIPGRVVLNYSAWQVPLDNFLQFGNTGLIANHFEISKSQEKIALMTTAGKDSIVSISFHALELENITRMVRGVVPASGKLNGDLKFTTSQSGEFSSTLLINDLAILQKQWGDLTFSLTHAANKYSIDMQIKGNNNNVTAKGIYAEQDSIASINIALDLSPLNLALLEPLSFGQVKNIEGSLNGKMNLTGNFSHPVIRGELIFNEAIFTPTALNSQFTLRNEGITFREAGISFSNFTIHDDQGSTANLRGVINTKVYQEFDLDLYLTSKDFQILNTKENNNKLVYGKVKINTTAHIYGQSDHPEVVMKVGLSDDTNITYVVPQSERNVLEQKGIVVFIDRDAKNDPFLASINPNDTIQSSFKGITLSANIELSGKEILNVVMDPITEEKLTVQGNSTLTLDMDPSGNISLSGRYEITKGTYNLSFHNIVKREFSIVKGGSITWSGDPLDATLDIRASNQVETSPLDLIISQTTTTNQAELNSYRQRLPFLIYLNINGQLLAPQISFQLDMPSSSQNAFGGAIYAKIQDINTRESDLNKQVFALLILRRFISDNPLESQAGSDLSNSTRTSASRLLTEQLNRLSQNIKGVQLSVDIKSYEDYSGGEAQGRTSAQLGVSKSVFKDRLVVKLAGNVDIEGQNTNQGSITDYIGDLALEYKLTEDGRFRITGFRNSNYDMLDGELVETGAGLIYIKDYDTLRELFKANEEAK